MLQLTLRADHQTSTLLCATIDSLDDVDQLLLVLQDPVQLIIVSSTEIAHHMFIAEEEHKGDWIVEFYERDISASLEKKMPEGQNNNNPTAEGLLTVHLLEIGDLVEITDVDDGKILHTVGDACDNLAEEPKKGRGRRLTIEDFVLSHAIRIPITTEADDDQSLVFRHNSLVDVPASDEMGKYNGTHV